MTEREQALIECYDYLISIGLPTVLTGSTLLGIYRDGHPIGGIFELDFLVEDAKPDIWEQFTKSSHYQGKADSKSEFSVFYFESGTKKVELQGIYFKDGKVYKNLRGDEILVWPQKVYGRHGDWKTINWGGRSWNMPAETGECLADFYGWNWRTPQDFNWNQAVNKTTLDKI